MIMIQPSAKVMRTITHRLLGNKINASEYPFSNSQDQQGFLGVTHIFLNRDKLI